MSIKKSSNRGRAADPLPTDAVETIKLMCRLLEDKKRRLLASDRRRFGGELSQAQFARLMMIRNLLPCNLTQIMEVTGLTSAGASLFVERLVRQGVLQRVPDPEDRRNVRISASLELQKALIETDEQLSRCISDYFSDLEEEELSTIARAGRIICRELSADGAAGLR